jgi:hypothetical protein
VLPILRRFDLLEAVTDARYVRGRWMSPGEFAGSLGAAFVPRPVNPAKAGTAGERWAVEVRNASKPTRPGVSLAEGMVAEGYALAGPAGVVVECLLLALITVAGARALAVGGTVVFSLGCSLVFLPTLQERGLLGVAEVLAKGVQVALVVGLLSLVFGGLRRVRRSGDAPRPVDDVVVSDDRPSGHQAASDHETGKPDSEAGRPEPVERYITAGRPAQQLSTHRKIA